MRRRGRSSKVSGAVASGLLAAFVSVSAAAGYSFDTPGHYLAGASALPAWAQALERHATERAAIRRCLDAETACQGKLKSLRLVLQKGASLEPDRQLRLVNRYVNKRRYRRDRRALSPSVVLGGEAKLRNHWPTLLEFLERGGDCEDYATAKYFLLRELGFDADDLRVLVTYDRWERAYHAVLAVRRSDGGAWLLESDNSVRRANHGQYRFIYAVNEDGIWDHER